MTPKRAREIAYRVIDNWPSEIHGFADAREAIVTAIGIACAEERAEIKTHELLDASGKPVYLLISADEFMRTIRGNKALEADKDRLVALLQEIYDHYNDGCSSGSSDDAKRWQGIMERVQDLLAKEKL